MTSILAIGLKFLGFLLGAIALEDKMGGEYSIYLIIYSLIGFLSFISELGIYYNVSNESNSNQELSTKLGRVLITSALSSVIGVLFLWISQRENIANTILLFMFLPMIINLSLMLRGVLVKERAENFSAVYDAFAFGLPGFMFYFIFP